MSHYLTRINRRGRKTAMMSLVTGAVAMVTAFGFSPAANAVDRADRADHHSGVFVHTNDPVANAVIAYERAADGQLTEVNSYATGGKGASEDGAVADPLASQGSLTYDADHRLLFAVNGGSNTVTVFAVHHGTRLQRLQTIWSGGVLPTSVSVVGRLVYVLNAGGDGDISGFRITPDRRLHPIEHSTRSLGLGNPANPNFLKSPSQVEIAPDASAVVVATKTNGVLESSISITTVLRPPQRSRRRRPGRCRSLSTSTPPADARRRS